VRRYDAVAIPSKAARVTGKRQSSSARDKNLEDVDEKDERHWERKRFLKNRNSAAPAPSTPLVRPPPAVVPPSSSSLAADIYKCPL
jgi:hypothetical protein